MKKEDPGWIGCEKCPGWHSTRLHNQRCVEQRPVQKTARKRAIEAPGQQPEQAGNPAFTLRREAVLARKKKYYEENREAVLAGKKKYYEENREAVLAGQKKYYEENREAVLAGQKKYYEENREAA